MFMQTLGRHASYGGRDMLSGKRMSVIFCDIKTILAFSQHHAPIHFGSDLTIHKLFSTRADLHRTVYTHAKVKVQFTLCRHTSFTTLLCVLFDIVRSPPCFECYLLAFYELYFQLVYLVTI